MATLKSAGIVTDRRDGKWVHYRLGGHPLLAGMSGVLETLSSAEPYVSDGERLGSHKKGGACH